MAKQKILRNNSAHFVDEKNEIAHANMAQQWLIISAWLLLFFVLPLLFAWSSLGRIHVRPYSPSINPSVGQFYTQSKPMIPMNHHG